MDARELRIGNLLEGKQGPVKVTRIYSDYRVGIGSGDPYSFCDDNRCLDAIPLTEEWIIKFGFKRSDTIGKSPSFYFKYVGASELHICHQNGVVWIERGDNIFNNPKLIVYLHQLQNLYFALTGEELTIKE